MGKPIGTIRPPAQMQSTYRSLFLDIERMFPSLTNPVSLGYLLERLAHEGPEFALVTLPLLGKATERALIQEKPLEVPPGFQLRGLSRLPIFLNHLFNKVFEEDGNPIYTGGNSDALLLIRSVTLLYSKVEGPVDERTADEAVEAFRSRTLGEVKIENLPELNLARELLHRVFDINSPLTLDLRRFRKKPWGRHGPGAVADHSSPSEKWVFTRWKGVSPELFRYNAKNSLRYYTSKDRPAARIAVVPKDFRGPRIICVEPKENQFAQQGLMILLYDLLTRHPLTRRAISFDDTTASESLCFRMDIGTIDLKDASDRLSLGLARLLLPRWLFKLVTRYRTSTVRYKTLMWKPNCLATMGNACCFPLETLIFWALAQSTCVLLKWANNTPVYPLRVFGDDIIIPRHAVDRLSTVLAGCGLVINKDKTCSGSLIRESCGEWVYSGKSQRLVKVRSTDVRDHRSWLQGLAYYGQLRRLGLFATAEAMMNSCKEFLPESRIKSRWNRNLQRLEFSQPAFANVGRRAEIDGIASLYAKQVHNDVAPFLDAPS